MQRSDLTSGIKTFGLAYPGFDLSDEQIDFWFERFKKYDAEEFESAVIEHVESSPYNPTIASLMQIVKVNREERDLYPRLPSVE